MQQNIQNNNRIFSNIIRKNQCKLYWYMFIITVFIGVLGYIISSTLHFGLTGTGCFLIGAGIVDFIAYYYSDKLIIKSENAMPVSDSQIPQLYELVNELCTNNNIEMPKLYMIDSKSINAFATGRNKYLAVLVVTRGLLEKLSIDEIRGVIGHELSHIETEDVKLMSVLSILTGLVCIIADIYWTNVMNKTDNDQSGIISIIGMVLSLFAPITSILIKLSVSRSREFAADARGAEMSGNPEFLANALKKIKKDRIKVPYASKATAHLFFTSPFKDDFIGELFSTHPDIDERIRRLLDMKN